MASTSLHAIVPDPEALLTLEPEELAGVVLQYLNSLPEGSGQLNRYNFSQPLTTQEYPSEYHDRLRQALMEAWVWLEREGLLAPKPGTQGEWVFITRRGKQLATAADLKQYRRSNLLPKTLLHARIAQKVWAAFLRGDYDTAVFQAFKEVEIQVRQVGSFADTDYGVELMRKAFAPKNGLLTNPNAPKAEQEALAHLFAGAIGSYKNPHSHRNISIDAQEAVEMIILASHLLNIVDRRTKSQ